MQHMEVLKKDGVKSLFIEVVISTCRSCTCRSCGFKQAGVRKNYYERGDGVRENALIMRKGLDIEPSARHAASFLHSPASPFP
jgi:hypothetical protein